MSVADNVVGTTSAVVLCRKIEILVALLHAGIVAFSCVHASNGCARNKPYSLSGETDVGICHSLTRSHGSHQRCTAHNLVLVNAEHFFHLAVGEFNLAHRQFFVSRPKIVQRGNARLTVHQRAAHGMGIVSDGAYNSKTSYRNIHPLKAVLFFAIFADVLGNCSHALEDFLALGRTCQLNAVLLLKKNDEFESIDRIESKAFAKQRCVGIKFLYTHLAKIQHVNYLQFQLVY